MFHYFVSEAEGVCGASIMGNNATEFGGSPYVVFALSEVVLVTRGLIVVLSCWGTSP